MILDSKLEITPVFYGNSPVKLLSISSGDNLRCTPLHWHDRFEMLIIKKGGLRVKVSGVEYIATEGDIVVINPGCTHEATTLPEGVQYLVIMFELAEQFIYNKLTERTLAPIASKTAAFKVIVKDKEILNLVDRIYEVSEQSLTGSELILTGLVYEMLGILVQNHIDRDYINPASEERFKNILEYISKNFTEDITSLSISKKFGYDNTYFGRRFKEITGLSPTKYIRTLRLEKARKLIVTSSAELSSIALECGFSDLNYFSRCFKAHYQISATEYRKRNK